MNKITTAVIRIGITSIKVEAKLVPMITPTANRIRTARNASAKSYSQQHLVVHLQEFSADSL